MRNFIIVLFTLMSVSYSTAQKIAPYIKVGESSESMQAVSLKVATALSDNSFTILGSYNPSGKSSQKVIAFTRNDIKRSVVKVKDRGALAAVFKVGLQKKGAKVIISYTNPEYYLRAYLLGSYSSYSSTFERFSADLKTTLSSLGNEFTSFGGGLSASDLKSYHYKVMMPYFTDPVELKEFASFEEGLKTIQDNLIMGKGDTKQVYRLLYKANKVAVFGVALKNKSDGESYFLPKIGASNLAALPYEIILQDNKATMLHGKYRLALSWPELSMSTFMKIMSTPGDIEDTLKGLCE